MEYILHRRITDDLVEYLVKFVGYDEPEWVNKEDIDGLDMIQEFERRFPKMATKRKSAKSAVKSQKSRLKRRAASTEQSAVPPSDRVTRSAGKAVSIVELVRV